MLFYNDNLQRAYMCSECGVRSVFVSEKICILCMHVVMREEGLSHLRCHQTRGYQQSLGQGLQLIYAYLFVNLFTISDTVNSYSITVIVRIYWRSVQHLIQ